MPRELEAGKYFKEDHPVIAKMNSFIFNERDQNIQSDMLG